MTTTLLTPFEVIKYSGAGSTYPLDNIRLLLPIIERDLFINHFGSDFYTAILKDKKDFTKVQQWVKGIEYKAGDLVIYEYQILESTRSVNTSEPSVVNDTWKEVSKFYKKSYNELYDQFLKYIIALKVYKQALPQDTIKSSAKGLSISIQDNSGNASASAKDLEYIQRQIESHIDMLLDNCNCWILQQYNYWKADNTKGFDYSLISFASDSSNIETQNKGTRRIGFLN